MIQIVNKINRLEIDKFHISIEKKNSEKSEYKKELKKPQECLKIWKSKIYKYKISNYKKF